MAEDAISHFHRSLDLFEANKVGDTKNILSEPIKISPQYAVTCFKKGVELETDKRLNEAIEYYDKPSKVIQHYIEPYSTNL